MNIFHLFNIFNGCLLYMLVNQCMADLTIIKWKLPTALLQPHSQNQVLLPEGGGGGGGVNFGFT